MNIIGKLKKAIGMADKLDAESGLGDYARDLTNNAKTKLRNRKREAAAKKSRRANSRRSRGAKWRVR